MAEPEPVQESAQEPVQEPEETAVPTDPADVQGWLARIRPATVVALLKDPDYAFAVSRAFLGFRPDAKGYANPLIRTRLVQAATKDEKLAAKLREIAEAEPEMPAPAPKRPAAFPSPAPSKPDPAAALREERDARRREREEARQALAERAAASAADRKARQTAEAERDEAARTAKKQGERIARLERQILRLEQGEVRLLKALGEDKVSPPPASPARSAPAAPAGGESPESPWLVAVRHLLDKSKFEQALALAEDVLKSQPDSLEALDIAAQALERKDAPSAAPYARRLLGAQVGAGQMVLAADTLRRLLRFLPRPEDAQADARRYLAALDPADGPAVEAGRRLLSRLRGADPAAHGWLAGVVAAQTALGPVLMPPPGALGPDDALPLGPGRSVTARQAVEAVSRGDVFVHDLRAALLSLTEADPEAAARVWAALEQASADEPGRLTPLRRTPRGPVVVDGSNVAWFDQEALVQGRPRLRPLLAIRRALWQRGFFPVVLYADANLPYFIDEPAALRLLRDRGELTLVDAGTVADEVLLRQARHLAAPLVTNDRMEDWDPNREVPKVRYAISLGGEAHLLDEL